MIKKLFYLWHNHTIGCVRVLMILLIPTAISNTFGFVYSCFLLIWWLIVNTGYEKKWHKEE